MASSADKLVPVGVMDGSVQVVLAEHLDGDLAQAATPKLSLWQVKPHLGGHAKHVLQLAHEALVSLGFPIECVGLLTKLVSTVPQPFDALPEDTPLVLGRTDEGG